MTLKERVKALADERGISLPTLESELGFGNSTIVKWDKSTPNAEKLNTVAKFFNVSMDYLLNGTDKDGLSQKDNNDIAKDLEIIKQKLINKESGPTRFEGTDIPEDDLEMFAGQIEIMLRRLKTINKEKYNPNKNNE